ncbi:MAG: hypothetical protein ACJAT5_000625 [Lentimonas sp.]|jgi:hypothetical protein
MLKLEKQSKSWFFSSLLAFSSLVAASLNGGVVEWQFEKIVGYTQDADGSAGSESAWAVEIFVEMDDYPNDATMASISGLGGDPNSTINMTWEDGEWLLEKEYADKAALDAEFPSNSNYTITLSGGTLGTLAQTVTPGAEVYPNIPYFTGTVFSDLSSVDAASSFDFTWGSSGTSTAIFIEIYQPDANEDIVDVELANTATSYAFPADTFPAEAIFEGDLFFSNALSVSGSGGFGTNGLVGHARSLQFTITTQTEVPGPTPAVLSWELEKGGQYVQKSDDTVPSVADFWFFYVEVETANADDANSAEISGGNLSGSLALTRFENEWTLEQEYESELALNGAYPDEALYTITLSGGSLGTLTQEVTFAALTAPNIPYLTGNDFSRARSVDASADFDFHWNAAGAATYIEIEFGDSDVSLEANNSSDWMGTLEGSQLDAGYCYDSEIFFANEQTVSGVDGFGVDGFILRSRITTFDAFTVLSPAVDAIVGAWEFGEGISNASGILLFQADGTYFHAEDVIADGSEVDGMERGTYTWDANTGLLTAISDIDTNGELGLSEPEPSFTATVEGDELTIADSESTTLYRVNDPSNFIVGGWRICDNANSNTGMLIFLDNDTYFHAEVDSVDGSGMERGTYEWDSLKDELTISSTPVDTNVEIGLADAGTLFASVSGRKVLTIGDSETTQLYRVSNAAVLPEWRLNKSRDFTQDTNDTEPTVDAEWSIWGLVELRNPNDAITITLSGTNGSGTPFTVNYDEEEPGEWTFEPMDDLGVYPYPTEALLDADYPNGVTFTITLSGGELGTLTQEIQSSAGYPTIPYLTGTTFSDALEIDPTASFDFTWNSHSDASVSLVISSLQDEAGDEYFEQTELVTDLTTMTIPAGTIPAGSTAFGYLEFNNVTSDTSGSGGFGVYGFASNHSTLLDFPIGTLDTQEVINDAFVEAGLTEEADALPTATPFDDGVENLLKYAFNMNLAGPDSSTLEDGGSSGLPSSGLKEVEGETVWQVEFVRPKGSGLIFTPKKSTTLTSESFVAMTGSVSTEDLGGGLERVTISEPCDPTTTPVCFSIVEVELPE